eukprot:11138242-Alexandrium_andersonii.AAC.1
MLSGAFRHLQAAPESTKQRLQVPKHAQERPARPGSANNSFRQVNQHTSVWGMRLWVFSDTREQRVGTSGEFRLPPG